MITIRDKVRFVETDMMGVVHHANYLRWFEMGRVAYLRACGITLGELMDAGVVFTITEVKMTAFNKAKMEFDYKIIRLRDGAVAVEGHTRNVFTDKEGRIIRLEPRWFDKIQKVYAAEKAAEE